MTLTKTTLLVTAMIAASAAGTTYAESLYGTAMIGKSIQATDSEPYGDNIAADSDFPAEFDSGDGIVGTIGVGYAFANNPVRVEGRLSMRNGEFTSTEHGTGTLNGEEYILDGEIKSTALTVEAFYDIPTGTKIKPYVKAGIGASRNSYSARLGGQGVAFIDQADGTADGYYDNYADQTSTEFTWNVGVGASYAINDQVSLIGEYQYIALGDASTGQDAFTDGFKIDKASAHEVQVGVQVTF